MYSFTSGYHPVDSLVQSYPVSSLKSVQLREISLINLVMELYLGILNSKSNFVLEIRSMHLLICRVFKNKLYPLHFEMSSFR